MSKALDRVIVALRDCVSVMERDLNGLSVIQPELAQAKKALDELDLVDADFVEWDGEGLPPVGIECDADFSHCGGKIVRVKVIAHITANRLSCAVYQYGDEVNYATAGLFRPLRTPEQIAAEEREKSAMELFLTINWNDTEHDWKNMDHMRRNDYLKAIDAGYRKTTE